MEFRTAGNWNEPLWDALEVVYQQAFSHGTKSKTIVRRLLDSGDSFLHVGMEGSDVVAMALSAKLHDLNALLIDYLGVREDRRRHGIGAQFVDYIKEWAVQEGYDGLVIEVESEREQEPDDHPNAKRTRFWDKCGFHTTSYIHDYKVVPELYRAMYLNFTPKSELPEHGEELFSHIARYHKKAWGGK
ncbi:GNAT family N-acetyltransferase [Alicyclobacillus fastidiosus]|uniref:GNAT family N-acetyltransferase n=1 Tax=Alicyclobacillus fastidiosus TaxID=392011 RepID=A0ABV5A9Y3_9BACL|nr:GNAT family N-acetyltransferase [Alicyclobacillus fastidiosus]WEH10924.1 GNAT family N-acetyltransferase [Alicyclobacillus fastidiosus]